MNKKGSNEAEKTLQPLHPRWLVHNIFRIGFILDKTINQQLEKEGKMTFSQLRTLMGIMFHPEMTQNDIARFLHVTKAAVSRQIDQLQKKGLIERKVRPTNRREHIITLTKEGKKEVHTAFTSLDVKLEEMFESVEQSEMNELNKTLNRMVDIIHTSIQTKGRSDPDLDRMLSMKDPDLIKHMLQTN